MKKKLLALLMLLFVVLFMFSFPVETNAYSRDASVVVNLALNKVGTTYPNGYCLAFVKDTFDSAYGFSSSACCAYKYGSSYIDNTSRNNIPLGASVFFAGSKKTCSKCNNKCGHIGIYVGNDSVVHVWNGKVVKYTIDRIIKAGYPYRGWGWHGNYELSGGVSSNAVESFSGKFKVMCASKTLRSASNGSSTNTRTVNKGDVVNIIGYEYNQYGNLWYKTDKNDYIHSTMLKALEWDSIPPADYRASQFEVMCTSKTIKNDPYGSADTIKTVTRGTRINVTGYVYNTYGNLWYETDDGYYIYCDYLSVINSEERMPSNYLNTQMKVKASSKTVFGDPYGSASVVKSIEKDSFVNIKGYVYNRYGNLWYITDDGYIYSGYLEQTKQSSDIPSNYKYHPFSATAEKDRVSEPYASAQEMEKISAGEILYSIGYMINLYGNKWYECDDGWFFYDSSLSCVHSWNSGVVTQNPSCTTNGKNTYTCIYCASTRNETIAATGHGYGEWTKLNDSQHQRVCSRNSSHVEKANHNWNSGVVTKAATCTSTGSRSFTCTVCKATKIEAISSLGHNTINHSAKAATCTANGNKAYVTCSRCNYTTFEKIPALGHNTVKIAGKAATCTETGLSDGAYCTRCDYRVEQTVTPKAPHSVVTDKAVAPSCTKTGLTEGSHCSVCNTVITAQKTVEKTAHTVVTDEAVAPSCTKTGLTEGSHCSVCNTVITAQKTVAKTAHTIVKDSAVEPTCDKTGLTEGSHCSVCNTVITAQKTVAKTAHTIVKDSAVEPTCDKTGLTEGSHCSVCNTVITAQQTIPAKGHEDRDNDGKCDDCGGEVEKNPSEECKCICHKKGISKFFYKIARFFWKIFKTHKTCDCGVNHY